MSRLLGILRPRGRGQALTEFAIVLPIFLLLFFGLIDVGRFIFVNNALNEASREGARAGAVQQWQFSCPTSVPVGSRDRLTCTDQLTLDRVVSVGANVEVGANECVPDLPPATTSTCTWHVLPICQTVDGPIPPQSNLRTVIAANCGSNDLMTVSTRVVGFQFLTPIIGRFLGTPTLVGTTQVVIQ